VATFVVNTVCVDHRQKQIERACILQDAGAEFQLRLLFFASGWAKGV